MLQSKQKLSTVSCVMYGATSMRFIPQRCGYKNKNKRREREHIASTCHVNAGRDWRSRQILAAKSRAACSTQG